MKKYSRELELIILVLCMSLLFANNNAAARSGCCSHHGGVCGCGCCDGTSLSATCAPYYPCSHNTVETQLPTRLVSTTTVTTTAIISVTESLAAVPNTSSTSGNSTWGWMLGLGAVGAIMYFVGKHKK